MNCFRNLSVAIGLPVRRGFAAAAKSKKLTKLTQKLGFVGGGRMAESIIRGLLAKELVDPKDIMMSDPEPERRALMESLGIVTTDDNLAVVDASGIVLLGVKPNTILSVCRNISKSCGSLTKKSFISIAAGVRLEDLEMAIPSAKGFVRTMPNINSLVGEAATSLALGTKLQEGGTSGETYQSCAAIFSAVGTISLLEDEDLMDAATGLAGSGPAFVFMLIESLADGGVRMGLSRENSMTMAAQTVMGSAKMVLSGGSHPGALKDMVCSPGGTTIAGVQSLEESGFRAAAMAAVEAATIRSQELHLQSTRHGKSESKKHFSSSPKID